MLADLGGDNLGSEAHGRNVETVAVAELGRVSLHEVHNRFERVGHVHHIHIYVGRHGAGVVTRLYSLVEYLHSIVGGATAGHGYIGDDAGEAHATGVNTKAAVVVVAEHLARNLAHTIDGVGLHHNVLRGVVLGVVATKGTNATGRKERATILAGNLQRVHQRPHVDVPRTLGILLAGGGEYGHKVEDGVDVIAPNECGVGLAVENVENLKGTVIGEEGTISEVGSNDILGTIDFAKMRGQLGANLAACACDKNTFHIVMCNFDCVVGVLSTSDSF